MGILNGVNEDPEQVNRDPEWFYWRPEYITSQHINEIKWNEILIYYKIKKYDNVSCFHHFLTYLGWNLLSYHKKIHMIIIKWNMFHYMSQGITFATTS